MFLISGLVPLHNACSYGHYDVTELLIKVSQKCDKYMYLMQPVLGFLPLLTQNIVFELLLFTVKWESVVLMSFKLIVHF